MQELVDVMEAWFAGRLRVIEVERILNGAVADGEISVGLKPPVLAAPLPLLASFLCPLTASFSYLLVAYGVADLAS